MTSELPGWLWIPHITKVVWGFPTQSLPHTETHAGLHVKWSLLSDFNQNWSVLKNVNKTQNARLYGNPFSCSQVVKCIQTLLRVVSTPKTTV
jgi:hypothetical protein